MRNLPASEHHGQLDLVPLLKKAPRVAELEFIVVVLDPGPELHFLDLGRVLLAPGLPGGARRLVLVLPVVHHANHGRPRVGGHFDQIKSLLGGPGARLVQRNYSDLSSTFGDQSNRADSNLLVHPDTSFRDLGTLLVVGAACDRRFCASVPTRKARTTGPRDLAARALAPCRRPGTRKPDGYEGERLSILCFLIVGTAGQSTGPRRRAEQGYRS